MLKIDTKKLNISKEEEEEGEDVRVRRDDKNKSMITDPLTVYLSMHSREDNVICRYEILLG